MKTKHSYTGRAVSFPAGIAIGTGIALGICFTGALLLAWLISAERIGENAVGYGSMLILLLSSAVGCLAAQKLIKHRKWMVCAIECAALFCALLLMALPFGAQFEGIGINAMLITAGGVIAIIPSLVSRQNGAVRYKKRAFR